MRALLVVGVLVALVARHAEAQTAEEAVGMMMFGQSRAEFVDWMTIFSRTRDGRHVTSGTPTSTWIRITKLDRCRFEIVPRTGRPQNKVVLKDDRGSYASAVLPQVFDFAGATYKVRTIDWMYGDRKPIPGLPILEVLVEGSGIAHVVGADWDLAYYQSAQQIQQAGLDATALLRARDYFRTSFCPEMAP